MILRRGVAAAATPQVSPMLDRFGSLLARLHQLDWRPFATSAILFKNDPAILLDNVFASLRQVYMQFGMMDLLNVVDWLENHKSEIAVQPVVVHLDFHANNVFVCEYGQWAVIDWTRISVSDYCADLSWAIMLMGDFGQPQWGEYILRAYKRAALRPVEHLEYFNVISYVKLLASTVISLKAGPEALGMRPESVESVQGQAPVLRRLLERLQEITGLALPEIEAVLARFC